MKTPIQWIDVIKHAEGEQLFPVSVDEEDISSIQTDAFWCGVRAALGVCIKLGLCRQDAKDIHSKISMSECYDLEIPPGDKRDCYGNVK